MIRRRQQRGSVGNLPAWVLHGPPGPHGRLDRPEVAADVPGETAVRAGRAVEDPGRQVPDAAGSDGDDPATLDAWLADAAQTFAGTLRNAGPGAEAKVWAFQRSTAFWARRAANDLVIHRADAAGTRACVA